MVKLEQIQWFSLNKSIQSDSVQIFDTKNNEKLFYVIKRYARVNKIAIYCD